MTGKIWGDRQSALSQAWYDPSSLPAIQCGMTRADAVHRRGGGWGGGSNSHPQLMDQPMKILYMKVSHLT